MLKKTLILFALVLTIFIGIYVTYENAYEDRNVIKVSGNIELTEVEVSFEVPGQLLKRLVSEGEQVNKGEVIALLDTQQLEKEVGLKKANLEAAKAALLELEDGYLPEEIAQAKAQLDQAEANFEKNATDYQRQKRLFEGDVISSKEFDISESIYIVARAKVDEAKEKLLLLQKGIRKEKIAQAKASVQAAKQALELSEIRLDYGTLKSPTSGVVLSENLESGEYAAVGAPVVTIGNLKDIWLRAYIDETDLGKVNLGDEVEVSVDSFPDKVYLGKIVFISSEAEFTPKNIQTEKQRVKLVYRIKIKLNNPQLELKPGMPADGVIVLDQAKNL